MDGDSLRLLLGQGLSVEKIARRFGKHPSTVSYWLKKHGLEAPNREKYAGKGGIDRDELARLVESGMTIRQIASEVSLTPTTVRYWMQRYEISPRNRRGPRHGGASKKAKEDGFATVTLSCVHHGQTDFAIEGRGYYRCKRCRSDGVARRRRKLKTILVDEAGGQCCVCGYDRYIGALHFHHVDPKQKRLEISRNGVTLALDALRAEARKCVLVCSNCHAEIEGGLTSVPLQLPPESL